jgi:hypothetical protein
MNTPTITTTLASLRADMGQITMALTLGEIASVSGVDVREVVELFRQAFPVGGPRVVDGWKLTVKHDGARVRDLFRPV